MAPRRRRKGRKPVIKQCWRRQGGRLQRNAAPRYKNPPANKKLACFTNQNNKLICYWRGKKGQGIPKLKLKRRGGQWAIKRR